MLLKLVKPESNIFDKKSAFSSPIRAHHSTRDTPYQYKREPMTPDEAFYININHARSAAAHSHFERKPWLLVFCAQAKRLK
jgi:hypothetical protein